jgi:hypothetical protein
MNQKLCILATRTSKDTHNVQLYQLTVYRLKDRLRSLILAKNVRPGTDFQALIDLNHKDANMKALKGAKNSILASPSKRLLLGDADVSSAIGTRPERCTGSAGNSDSDSDDSVIGTTTRRRAFLEKVLSLVELRLYGKLTLSTPGSLGLVF